MHVTEVQKNTKNTTKKQLTIYLSWSVLGLLSATMSASLLEEGDISVIHVRHNRNTNTNTNFTTQFRSFCHIFSVRFLISNTNLILDRTMKRSLSFFVCFFLCFLFFTLHQQVCWPYFNFPDLRIAFVLNSFCSALFCSGAPV